MDRRVFLKNGCTACAALLVLPTIASLEGCASTRSIAFTEEGSVLTVPVKSLAERTTGLVRPKSLMDPVLLVKDPSGGYNAFLMKCPHKGQPVALSGSLLVCDAHGSQFDMNGNVTKGPAKSGLKEFPVVVNGDQLEIDVKG